MTKDLLRIAIIGHTDHGKSTLIGRLLLDTGSLPQEKLKEIKTISKQFGKDIELAYIADQLKEERIGNLTIDTTQCFFSFKGGGCTVIDVPGHREFIKNMLTGASMAQAAILVVDAQEGVMEQTRRHFYLLSLLGIDKIIIVINKMDLVGYRKEIFDKLKTDLLGVARMCKIKPLYFVPVSAKEGINIVKKSKAMRWYKGLTLLKAFKLVKSHSDYKRMPLRFIVQDSYDFNGSNIIAGKVCSGVLETGDKITLLPSKNTSVIKSIVVFRKQKKVAYKDECVGLVLKDARLVKRGDIIVKNNDYFKLADNFEGVLFWVASKSAKINKMLKLRCATQDIASVIKKIKTKINTNTLKTDIGNFCGLKQYEAGRIVIKTESQILMEGYSFIPELGRFVLLDDNNLLLGVGIILNSL